jgi:hypothetical protein
MSTEPRRNCPSCGNEFSGAMEFCPVCILRKALADGVESGESSSEATLKPATEQATQRVENYELVKGEDGKRSWGILIEGWSREKVCLLLGNLFPARCAGGFCCWLKPV